MPYLIALGEQSINNAAFAIGGGVALREYGGEREYLTVLGITLALGALYASHAALNDALRDEVFKRTP